MHAVAAMVTCMVLSFDNYSNFPLYTLQYGWAVNQAHAVSVIGADWGRVLSSCVTYVAAVGVATAQPKGI
jgi:hypothetical protein